MSTPGSIGSGIEHLVYQPVRLGVLLAAHVADRPALEALQRLLHLAVQLAHARVLDLVLSLDLPDDELGVADQLELARAERGGTLDAEQQRPVLGDVVGRVADPLAALLKHLPVRALDHGRDRRWPRIPPRPTVDVDDQLQRRLSQRVPRTRRVVAGAPTVRRPSRSTVAFQCLAARSSSRTSLPRAISKTGRRSSETSTPH